MKVETGNCIVNLDHFIDYTVYFEKEYCYLMGTDKNGDMRKYKIHGIKTLEETQFAFNELKMGLEDELSYVNISLCDCHAVNNEETKENTQLDDSALDDSEETEQPYIFAGK